ncbi:MAG: DUF58 domain-containing protein [Elusimicrobia bacterium]|nr:DUF58 domain-containing protein [Elusimicrobiota bacterium]
MIASEIIQQVRRIEIRARRKVSETFGGQYSSIFKGRGIEFAQVREYQPGEDARSIDWNVTARLGKPFVKEFVEERELTVLLALDMSASQRFGSVSRLKSQAATEFIALVALAAIRANDKVGFLGFTEEPEIFVPPRKGRLHTLRLIRESLGFTPRHAGTRIQTALEHLGRLLKRRAIIFLISDFMDHGFGHALKVISRKHELIPVWIYDPLEKKLPRLPVLLSVRDLEGSGQGLLDLNFPQGLEAYAALRIHKEAALRRSFRESRLDWMEISSQQTPAEALIRFFQKRRLRARLP